MCVLLREIAVQRSRQDAFAPAPKAFMTASRQSPCKKSTIGASAAKTTVNPCKQKKEVKIFPRGVSELEVAIAHSCEEHRHTRRSSARMEWTRAQVANVCG